MIFFRMVFGWLLQVIPFALLCFQPFGKQLRFTKKKTAVITLGLLLTTGTISALICLCLRQKYPPSTRLFKMANTIFMLGILPCLLWYFYAVRTIWPQKVFIFFYGFSAALIVAAICNPVITWVNNRILADHIAYDGLMYGGSSLAVYFFVSAIFFPIASRILAQYTIAACIGLSQRGNTCLALLSVILILFQGMALTYIPYELIFYFPVFFSYALLLTSVFIFYAVFFRMLRFTYEKLETQRKYNDIKHQFHLETEQYRRIHDSMEITRRMHHDLRHHMITLLGYLKKDNTELAIEYLNHFLQTAAEYEIPNICNNTIVNMLAGHYQALATEQDIDFSIRISIPENISIQDIDLSVVIGNLLENAFDAVLSADKDKRFVRFHMAYPEKALVITIDNGFNGKVKLDHETYLSTKENHNGQGLTSVRRIAEKYSGGVEFSHSENVFHSSVMLIL